MRVITRDGNCAIWRKRQLRALLTGSAAVFMAMSAGLSAHATFIDHWAPASEARVKQLLAKRISSDIYNVEQGGAIDLALYYAVRGQIPAVQKISDLPKLQPYLDAPLAEPLKADIFVALIREALRNNDFTMISDLTQSYDREVDSKLRNYAKAYAETVVLEDLGFYQAAEDAILQILENNEFQSLAQYARDRPENLRRLSALALARGDNMMAVSSGQEALLSYKKYIAATDADPIKTRGMKTIIGLTLAESLVASGQVDTAKRHYQNALTASQASGDDRAAIRAQIIHGEALLVKPNPKAALKHFQTLISDPDYDGSGPFALRVYTGLARVYQDMGQAEEALLNTQLAESVRKSLQSQQGVRQGQYLTAQKLAAELPAKTGITSAPTLVEVNADNRLAWVKKVEIFSDPQKLTYLGLGLTLLGVLLTLLAKLRVDRARRALEVYSQNLVQSEKIARENARKAEENMRLAEVANDAKTAFLANMSHEIRTPMNGVLGMADALRRTTELDSRQSEIVEAIHTSGAALMTVLGDILDFSKIESGTLNLNIAPTNLRDAVEAVATLMSVQARDKGLEVLVRYAPEAPEYFNADIGRIRQTLLNLVGNAIKFTTEGHVLINVDVTVNGPVAVIKINVLDTGIGITPESQNIIFDDFVQADQGRNKRHGGTGLGLSISKKLIEAMDGEISIKSKVGEGSVFSIELPLTLADDQGKKTTQVFNSGRVLLIDNNAARLKIVSAQLKTWGLSSTVTRKSSDGISGLLQAKNSGEIFDAVIIDHRCAGKDNAFIEDLNSHPTISQTPVILLSDVGGYNAKDYSGYNAQVSKPVVGYRLFEALKITLPLMSKAVKTIPVKRTRPVIVSPAPERSIKRVLLAEANPATRHVIAAFLEDKSVELHTVADGEQALESAKTADFDLILMDAQLRKLDGFLATRAIRGHEANGKAIRTPIICLSPFALGADQDLATAVGMDDFLVKPLSPQSLQNIMDKWGGIKADIRAAKAAKLKAKNRPKDPMVQAFKNKRNKVA